MSNAKTIARLYMSRLASIGVRYVHFTDQTGAEAIVKSKRLNKSSYVSGVYAVAEGGHFSKGVAQTSKGRAQDRNLAVIFTTKEWPNIVYPEEVIWHEESIRLSSVKIVPAKDGIRLLNRSKVNESPDLLWETVEGVPWWPDGWSRSDVMAVRDAVADSNPGRALMLIRKVTGYNLETCKEFYEQFKASLS